MGWFRNGTSTDAASTARSLEERLRAIGPGVPGRCPSCDGLGYIDDLDIGHRYQIQHCKDCGHRWEYLFDRDGRVVGLTELDEAGQPVARMRVRPREATPAPVEPAVAAPAPEPPAPAPAPDVVIDLRDRAPEPAPASTASEADEAPRAAEHLSPAEWLRHAVRR